jgi:pyridoxine 4-dehydrogenase
VSRAQLALAWLLHHSPVLLPIPGTSSIAHLEENCRAATIVLDAETLAALDVIALPGSDPEQTGQRARHRRRTPKPASRSK